MADFIAYGLRVAVPVLTVALALLAAVGCTRQEDGAERIKFSVWGSKEQIEVERRNIADFERTHPTIKVDLLTFGANYTEKLQAMMVGDVAPDVISMEIEPYPDWASRGVLADLTAVFDEMRIGGDLLPLPSEAFILGGKSYGLPVNCHGLVMHCNLDALAKAGIPFPENGATWEQMIEWAPKLSKAAGNKDAPTDYSMMLPPYCMLLWAFGADLFDNPHAPTKVTVDTPQAVQALNLIRLLVSRRLAAPPDVISDQGDYQLFRDGRVAFYFSGRWTTPAFAGQTAFQWDVAPPPSGTASNPTLHGGTALGVYAKSLHKKAAVEFVRFCASKAGALNAMRLGRTMPVYRSMAFGDELLGFRPPRHIIRFSETMEAGKARRLCYTRGALQAWEIFEGYIGLALGDPLKSSESIVADMAKELERWLEKQSRIDPAAFPSRKEAAP